MENIIMFKNICVSLYKIKTSDQTRFLRNKKAKN